jgi:hypothetical protein
MKKFLFLFIPILIVSCEKFEENDQFMFLPDPDAIHGCMDPIACNYDPEANASAQNHNGAYGCDYSCLGCNDPTACNYNYNNVVGNNDGCLYLSNCNKTYVPDNNFEAYLENEQFSLENPFNTSGDFISNNNYVFTELLDQESLIIASWLPTVGISDLTGIEDFSSLKHLSIFSSSLGNLDLKNGLNHILTSLSISDCPNLSCVQVDDSNWSTNNWTNVDSQIYFSEDCQ